VETDSLAGDQLCAPVDIGIRDVPEDGVAAGHGMIGEEQDGSSRRRYLQCAAHHAQGAQVKDEAGAGSDWGTQAHQHARRSVGRAPRRPPDRCRLRRTA
jgi:hypothetical protein